MHVAVRVGMFRHHHLSQLNARCAHWLWVVGLIHGSLVQVLTVFTSVQCMQTLRFVEEDVHHTEAKITH
jgi:hypothetical protein